MDLHVHETENGRTEIHIFGLTSDIGQLSMLIFSMPSEPRPNGRRYRHKFAPYNKVMILPSLLLLNFTFLSLGVHPSVIKRGTCSPIESKKNWPVWPNSQ